MHMMTKGLPHYNCVPISGVEKSLFFVILSSFFISVLQPKP